jgi:predicted nucleic acid-binding protein
VIVVDSSFLIGFYNDRDAHHESARALMRDLLAGRWGKGLLLEYVFLEVVTVLLLRVNRVAATDVAQILLEAEELEFVPCSEFFSETVTKFTKQVKTRLSFVDMAIALVAGDRTEGLVLSFDEEFRKLPAIHLAE